MKDHEVDEAVVMTVASVANRRLDYPALERKGEIDMYAVFEETRMEGKMEGRAEEIVKMGIEFGLSSEDIVERLQKKLNISKQKAKAYLEQFSE